MSIVPIPLSDEESTPPPRPGVINVAFYVTLVLGLLSLGLIPWNPFLLIQTALCLIAAFGIHRRRAWSAYGLALLTLVPSGVLVASGPPASVQAWILGIALLLSLTTAALLFSPGRALERRHGRRGMAWPWVTASVLAGMFFALFGLYQIRTTAMGNTLLVGDRIAVWKAHGKTPVRGEMVVHRYPPDRKQAFVKRVVGLPGDRLRIINKQLCVNGAPVVEPYVEHTTAYVDSYRDNFPSEATFQLFGGAQEMLANNVVDCELVVPPGRYFVLGDNRDASLDSRYWGLIDQSDIIGMPKFIYYSLDPGQNPGANSIGLPILHVRWSRLFRGVA